MHTPHFYQLHCNLGVYHIPYGSTEDNVGVETGPSAILTPDFLSRWPEALVDAFEFPEKATVMPEAYFERMADATSGAIDLIRQTLSPTETAVVLGGDHSVGLAAVAAMLDRHTPETTGFINIDSHTDIHQPSTSPSGNFHGMWIRPLVDRFEHDAIDSLVPTKIPTTNLLYLGNLTVEPAETEFLTSQSIMTVDARQLRTQTAATHEYLTRFRDRFTHLHISVDVDAFDKTVVTATGILNPDGLFLNEVTAVLALLRQHPSISIEVVEVNPRKRGSAETVGVAQEIIRSILEEEE